MKMLERIKRQFKKLALVFGMIAWLSLAAQVKALEGVGALADRLGSGVELRLLGKTAPWAEVVVVNEADEDRVVAVAEIEADGEFEFGLKFDGEVGNLVIFGVDEVGLTSRVVLEDVLGEEILLPPTIVNDLSNEDKTVLALTGFAYRGSQVEVRLTSNRGFVGTFEVIANELTGRWSLVEENLSAGKYTGVARSSFGNLESESSQQIYFEIAGLALPTVRQIFEEPETVAKLAVPAATVTALLPALLKDGIALLLRLILSLLNLFGWRKDKKSWGVVYDSITKQPLARCIVRLHERVGMKLVETDVTGDNGVFSFLPKAGEYVIRVVRAGFVFPSKLVRGKGGDGEYARLYHGEELKVKTDETVSVSIPLDPVKVKVTRWFYIKRFLGVVWNVISWFLLILGLLTASLALAREVNGFNVILFGVELGVVVWVLWEMKRRVVGWSYVKDAVTSNVLADVSLSLYDVEFKRLVQRRVSDERGRFAMVVPAGKYKLEASLAGWVLDVEVEGGFAGELIEIEGRRLKALSLKVFMRKV